MTEEELEHRDKLDELNRMYRLNSWIPNVDRYMSPWVKRVNGEWRETVMLVTFDGFEKSDVVDLSSRHIRVPCRPVCRLSSAFATKGIDPDKPIVIEEKVMLFERSQDKTPYGMTIFRETI